MESNERLTSRRVNGNKKGFWSPAKKEELIERLAEYEELGLTPAEMREILAERRFALTPDGGGGGTGGDGQQRQLREFVQRHWLILDTETGV